MGHYWSEMRPDNEEEREKDRRFNEYLARRNKMKSILRNLDFYEEVPLEIREALCYVLEVSLSMEKRP